MIPIAHLSRRYLFSASHRLHNPELSEEENRTIYGKCNNPYGHGHNYLLEVTVAGEADERTGMVLDIKELKALLDREVMEKLDHRFLNHEVAAFRQRIPTTENVAVEIWRMLEDKLPAGRLHRVRLYETPDLFVDYYGEQATA